MAGTHSGLALLLVSLVLLHGGVQLAAAAEWNVGGANGWTFGVQEWPNNKTFTEGDVLVFKYDPAVHNVIEGDNYGFGTCMYNADGPVYDSGDDRIKLRSGQISFLSGKDADCARGLKIKLSVTPKSAHRA